jgi:glycosyltransferase involved in cell wall biosynthesis
VGKVNNPFSVYSRCDLFVLSSLYEGFPNALLEAMACGLPVVSFDCPSGPGEIIQDGINGCLVPPENRRALKEAMGKLIDNESLRIRLSKEASKVKERFSIEKIMSLWGKLLT